MPKMLPSQHPTSVGNRRENTVGEQGHARGVPPLVPRHALPRANFNERCWTAMRPGTRMSYSLRPPA